MSKLTRKEFLGFGAALAGATGFASAGLDTLAGAQPSVGAAAGASADLIVTNARVLTSDPAILRVQFRQKLAVDSASRVDPAGTTYTQMSSAFV
jgi:hypothetical protein